jgi:hypothetical protein
MSFVDAFSNLKFSSPPGRLFNSSSKYRSASQLYQSTNIHARSRSPSPPKQKVKMIKPAFRANESKYYNASSSDEDEISFARAYDKHPIHSKHSSISSTNTGEANHNRSISSVSTTSSKASAANYSYKYSNDPESDKKAYLSSTNNNATQFARNKEQQQNQQIQAQQDQRHSAKQHHKTLSMATTTQNQLISSLQQQAAEAALSRKEQRRQQNLNESDDRTLTEAVFSPPGSNRAKNSLDSPGNSQFSPKSPTAFRENNGSKKGAQPIIYEKRNSQVLHSELVNNSEVARQFSPALAHFSRSQLSPSSKTAHIRPNSAEIKGNSAVSRGSREGHPTSMLLQRLEEFFPELNAELREESLVGDEISLQVFENGRNDRNFVENISAAGKSAVAAQLFLKNQLGKLFSAWKELATPRAPSTARGHSNYGHKSEESAENQHFLGKMQQFGDYLGARMMFQVLQQWKLALIQRRSRATNIKVSKKPRKARTIVILAPTKAKFDATPSDNRKSTKKTKSLISRRSVSEKSGGIAADIVVIETHSKAKKKKLSGLDAQQRALYKSAQKLQRIQLQQQKLQLQAVREQKKQNLAQDQARLEALEAEIELERVNFALQERLKLSQHKLAEMKQRSADRKHDSKQQEGNQSVPQRATFQIRINSIKIKPNSPDSTPAVASHIKIRPRCYYEEDD